MTPRFALALEFRPSATPVLDVGCGDGQYLLASAAARPDCDHLGIELIEPLVRKAREAARERGLSNVRFVAGDAVSFLRSLSPHTLDEIHVYHPQPYYDPAEVHLGMLTAGFFEHAWRATRPHATLTLQTDHAQYGKYLLEAVRKHFDPALLPDPWPDAPQGRTRREFVARRKKLPILRIVARRRDTPLDTVPPPPYHSRPGLRRRRLPRRRTP